MVVFFVYNTTVTLRSYSVEREKNSKNTKDYPQYLLHNIIYCCARALYKFDIYLDWAVEKTVCRYSHAILYIKRVKEGVSRVMKRYFEITDQI